MVQSDPMPRSERILVVEDDEFSQQLIELYLHKAGFSDVVAAANGRDALDIAKQGVFDLVLLDLNLPRISGHDVLRRLKKEGMLADTPVIVTSSVGNVDDIVQCMDLGAEDFLLKPFNVRLLEGRVSAILEKKRLRDEGRAAQERRARELQAAKNLQSLLSGLVLPSVGDRCSCDAAAAFLPAPEIGGDFHAVFILPDASTFFMLGTVAGDGVAAALAMAQVHGQVRRAIDRLAAEGAPVDPEAVLAWVNRELCHQGAAPADIATSLLAGRVDPERNAWCVACAGHPAPFRLSARQGVVPVDCDRGRPLGVNPQAVYAGVRWTGETGETLLAFSNGLLGVSDASGVPFGEIRARAVLETCPSFEPKVAVAALEAEVCRCAGRALLREDVTILGVAGVP